MHERSTHTWCQVSPASDDRYMSPITERACPIVPVVVYKVKFRMLRKCEENLKS